MRTETLRLYIAALLAAAEKQQQIDPALKGRIGRAFDELARRKPDAAMTDQRERTRGERAGWVSTRR